MNTLRFKFPARAFRLFLFTALVGLTGAVLQPALAASGGHGGMGMGMGMGMGTGMGRDGPGHIGRMLDQVGASAEQKAQISAFIEAARNDLKPVHAQLKTLRAQGAALFTQPNVDAAAIEAVRLQTQTLQGQASKRMAQALVESSRVLTPDQRAKMADLMNKRRAMTERHRAEADSLMGRPAAAK